jgi:hypothetical protein
MCLHNGRQHCPIHTTHSLQHSPLVLPSQRAGALVTMKTRAAVQPGPAAAAAALDHPYPAVPPCRRTPHKGQEHCSSGPLQRPHQPPISTARAVVAAGCDAGQLETKLPTDISQPPPYHTQPAFSTRCCADPVRSMIKVSWSGGPSQRGAGSGVG